MGRRLIEVMQVLVDQVHKGGYQHRVLEDSIYAETQKRIAAEKDRDHWKQARQDAHEAGELMRAEIETLRGAMAADDKRLRDAEQRVWPGLTWGCDAPDKMADAILHLRQQLAEQQAETVDVRRQRNNETDRLNATNAVSVQQRDEIAYLRTRLDEERSVSAGLRQQLDAANVTILAQKRGIQYLRLLIDKVRGIVGRDDAMSERLEQISQALDEFDHGTIEPTPSPGIERLQAFVNFSRRLLGVNMNYADVDRLRAALAELDAETTEPAPVAEQAEGGA